MKSIIYSQMYSVLHWDLFSMSYLLGGSFILYSSTIQTYISIRRNVTIVMMKNVGSYLN